MSKKEQLRYDRKIKSPIINATSKQQEKSIVQALDRVAIYISEKYKNVILLEHRSQWHLDDIVKELRSSFPDIEFHRHFRKSSIRPDGGILYIKGSAKDGFIYPILISEVKNQGTNDLREKEGLSKQAKGNAIERLGKNVIGLRTALLRECIFPFVCFGYGCDFSEDSSILDRVTTIAMFGQLNKTYLYNEEGGKFNRGSFYFRKKEWSVDDMCPIMCDIAERSVLYYLSKYTKSHFQHQ